MEVLNIRLECTTSIPQYADSHLGERARVDDIEQEPLVVDADLGRRLITRHLLELRRRTTRADGLRVRRGRQTVEGLPARHAVLERVPQRLSHATGATVASISRPSRRAVEFGSCGGYIGVLILGGVITQILHEGVVTELHLTEAVSAAAHVDAETGGVGRCGRAKESAGALRRCQEAGDAHLLEEATCHIRNTGDILGTRREHQRGARRFFLQGPPRAASTTQYGDVAHAARLLHTA